MEKAVREVVAGAGLEAGQSIAELEAGASLVLAQASTLLAGGQRPVPPSVVLCGMLQV